MAGEANGTYRVVSIGVGKFAEPYPALTYATGLTNDLGAALANLGYDTGNPVLESWTSETIGNEVLKRIGDAAPGDVLVVHVLTHGEVNENNDTLYVLGTDGQPHRQADVEGWLKLMHDGQPRPLVLFVLDICQSGAAARLPWLGKTADGTARAWVIAACAPGESAFNGRLTRATTNVLRSLSARELDIGPGVEYVPLRTVGRAIRAEVTRLAKDEGGLTQQVMGTQLDFMADAPDLPFFKNPAFIRHPTAIMVDGKEPGLTPFADNIDEPASWADGPVAWGGAPSVAADQGLGAQHFVDRVRGHGNIKAPPDAGCFTGRTSELFTLVQWLKYRPDSPRTLSVVTGGPGVGKSAVLGVIVCAAHPDLRDETAPLWSRARHTPDEMPHLVAVHARQRDLADVAASLARQLAEVLGSATDLPADPAALVAAVTAATGDVPVIVLDALDEATGAKAVVDDLVFPLIAARRADGTPACRLLIGTRRDGFEDLLAAAREQHGLIDLDETDRETLIEDLNHYVLKLLRTQPDYRDQTTAGARGAFAEELAAALSAPDGDRRWGEFLIASLYTHSFIRTTAGSAITDRNLAGQRGAACPRTLPEVLQLDLADRRNKHELRQVLQIVSLARGSGIPASVIDRCRPDFSRSIWATPTRQILADLGFYLRRSNDEDGTTLYRIFHEGLAEELRPPGDHPQDPGEILFRAATSFWEPGYARRPAEQAIVDAMLRDLGPVGTRRWDLAEPYVLRHALDHALAAGYTDPDLAQILLDPEFLLRTDPPVPAALEHLGLPSAWQARRILTDAQSALATLPESIAAEPVRRRAALALAAARAEAPDLASALCQPPLDGPEPPLPWRPLWTSGIHLSPTRRPIYYLDNFWPRPDSGYGTAVSALAAGLVNDKLTVVMAVTAGWIEIWPVELAPFGDSQAANRVRGLPRLRFRRIAAFSSGGLVRAVGISQGTEIVSADAEGKLLHTHIATGHQWASAQKLTKAAVTAIDAISLSGRVIAALRDVDGSVAFVNARSGLEFDHMSTNQAFVPLSADGKKYLLLRGANHVTVATYQGLVEDSALLHYGSLTSHRSHITTLTTMTLDGRPVAVTASLDGTVRFWDVPALREIECLTLPGPVQTVAPAGDNHLAVLCCGEAIIYARNNPRESTGEA